MSRTADPSRKPALLAQIIEHLHDQPIASLTFRNLATALGVSTFTLVYQFGTRAELLNDIVQAISQSQRDSVKQRRRETPNLDAHITQIMASFEWIVQSKNRSLNRLEFEAAMIEILDPDSHNFTRTAAAGWRAETIDTLEHMGLTRDDAIVEAAILNNLFYGFRFDLLVYNDELAATRAFTEAISGYRERIATKIERSF